MFAWNRRPFTPVYNYGVPMPTRKLEIVEVGPRDGLQNEPGVFPTSAKIDFVNRIVAAGTPRVETASFVNPKRVPPMADAEAVMKALPRREGVRYVGLVLNRRGFDPPVAAPFYE